MKSVSQSVKEFMSSWKECHKCNHMINVKAYDIMFEDKLKWCCIDCSIYLKKD